MTVIPSERASSAASVVVRLLRETRARDPEERHLRDRLQVQILDVDVYVGGIRLSVEEQREVVGREDLAEGQGRA